MVDRLDQRCSAGLHGLQKRNLVGVQSSICQQLSSRQYLHKVSSHGRTPFAAMNTHTVKRGAEFVGNAMVYEFLFVLNGAVHLLGDEKTF